MVGCVGWHPVCSVYRSAYSLAMVPPRWPDEQGRPLPTYPCPRPGCGRGVAIRFTGFRVEHLKHVGRSFLSR